MEPEPLELWNVHEGVPVFFQAQSTFNVLGRVADPNNVYSLTYSINGSSERPVFRQTFYTKASRLAKLGDFNIDTIRTDELQPENHLVLRLKYYDQPEHIQSVHFPLQKEPAPNTRLDLRGIDFPEQVGQLIDGRWVVNHPPNGEPYLEIGPEDAGLDRVLLLGDQALAEGYTVRARLEVTRWTLGIHNVGLLYHWNPHQLGDGTRLPGQWTTGLGYYYSHCKGLRIRTGINVHIDEHGQKQGDHIFGEAPLSRWRSWCGSLLWKATRGRRMVPQVVPGTQYHFELSLSREKYELTVWPSAMARPRPQLSIAKPPQLLPHGSVGIIAHNCGVRVYEFELEHHKSGAPTQ